MSILAAVVATQFVVIFALLATIYRLRKRPAFVVFQELQERALKAEKAKNGLESALRDLKTSNAAGVYMLDAKRAIDADRIAALIATALERGEGIAGYEINVWAMLLAVNPNLEEYPPHMVQLRYGNGAKIALYVAKDGKVTKLPKSLENLIEE